MNEKDGGPHAVLALIQRKTNSNHPRLLIIEKYTLKLLGENLHLFSVP